MPFARGQRRAAVAAAILLLASSSLALAAPAAGAGSAPAPAPSSGDASRVSATAATSPDVVSECPDLDALAFEALWEPAAVSTEPVRSDASVAQAAAALSLGAKVVRSSLEEYDALTQASASGDADAGELAAAWAAAAVANASLVNATAVPLIADADVGAFAVLECLKASMPNGNGSSQISAFVALVAASPLRKYLWLPSAAFFIPTNAAVASALATLGTAAVSTEVDDAFYAQTDAARASLAVGLHVVPDVSDGGSLAADHRMVAAGYDPGLLAYRTEGDSASVDRVWTVNSTVDGHTHAANILTRVGACASWNTASLFVIDALLACNGTGDACPFETDVGGVQYKPAVNARNWTL